MVGLKHISRSLKPGVGNWEGQRRCSLCNLCPDARHILHTAFLEGRADVGLIAWPVELKDVVLPSLGHEDPVASFASDDVIGCEGAKGCDNSVGNCVVHCSQCGWQVFWLLLFIHADCLCG